ncbi:protein kinase domain-containing protein [Nocardioides insulae]|uniref:protein kinase domain-containing protein n=1 Tax=Nocardioides insulae TaxID=394734 RepID=UPI0005641397|nr:protein kinase family protein [Nocardioides insulae]
MNQRYRLDDLLHEFTAGGTAPGRFWRGQDLVLSRPVAIHVIGSDDARAPALMAAARRSATVPDARILRVLDAVTDEEISYVVNEWSRGISLDDLVAARGPLSPRRAAYLAAEVAEVLAAAHSRNLAHGRLIPENVMVDESGAVRLIGFAVDAALYELPDDDLDHDLADLGGILYCALTGRWTGRSESGVPRPPEHHGHLMRPRQVRAGVPGALDDLCMSVLRPASGASSPPAREIHQVLTGFVGDPTGMPDALLRHDDDTSGSATQAIPLPLDGGSWAAETMAVPAVEEPPPPTQADIPTQAGMPAVDDTGEDGVPWFSPRSEKAPPPPPLEPPPEKPLFAPDPPKGEPVRRSRTGSQEAVTGSTGAVPPVLPAAAPPPEPSGKPGRGWLTLAIGIAAVVILLVGVVMAYNIGRGQGLLGRDDDPDDAASPSAEAKPQVVRRTVADDLDPEGDPPSESGDIVGLAVDGDPNTSWRTQTYLQQFGPGGLKFGVGLVIDLRQVYDVATVEVTFDGEPNGLEVYVTPDKPDDVEGLTPAATTRAGAQASVDLGGAQGRYVTVWLTSLPQVSDGYRAEIAEVRVLGVRS